MRNSSLYAIYWRQEYSLTSINDTLEHHVQDSPPQMISGSLIMCDFKIIKDKTSEMLIELVHSTTFTTLFKVKDTLLLFRSMRKAVAYC